MNHTAASTLANRFREVTLNGQWIANTNFKQQIESVDWKQAETKIGSLNTIAALTFHINYYVEGILNVFNGGTLNIRDKFSFDRELVRSEADWHLLRTTFCSNAEAFASHIENLSDTQLKADFVDRKYGSYQRNIDAMIEHAYYHLGQVSLIKKMILESETP